MRPHLHGSTTVGPYRIESISDWDGYLVQVHELHGREWRLLRGPFRYEDPAPAAEACEALREIYAARVRLEQRSGHVDGR